MTIDPDITADHFSWKDIELLQSADVLKVGTDAILIGTWMSAVVPSAHTIIDAGCGSGILALMAARAFPRATVVAIDSNAQAVALTQQNVAHNQLQERVRVLHRDLIVDHADDIPKADLVVTNPPFYFGQLVSPQYSNAVAKHASGTIGDWMKSLANVLNRNGRLCLIVPFDNAFQWIKAANDITLYCQRRMNVYATDVDSTPKRSMLLFGTTLCQPRIESTVNKVKR